MKLKGIDIKPGMIIDSETDAYVAFPTNISSNPIAFSSFTSRGWTKAIEEASIVRIFAPLTNNYAYSGKLLWDRKKEIVEVSMDKIAEKFGCSIEQLKSKK